ncbi:Heat-labile enterotoxin IIA, A chain [Beauveria brongniartii RCEF 3172]|uniref:Heat-labile enterotoxin IIA, A chain n=1 Tax=Beauveria brongniartii RCEF 3172 TaxID=1081107 RepID=A0A167DGL3_9HYPO|nr:Heat-labile enterotoxin IIA, A chain [Beauveria brongniartii RCEF 3172]
MKIAFFTLFVVAGTAIANPAAIQARGLPEPGSKTARELGELVIKGLQTWGLTGSVNALNGHPNAPLRYMPGGMPELNRHRPNKKEGKPGTPGSPLGPRKKQGRIYQRRRACLRKRGLQCPAGSRRSSKYPRMRLNGRGGVMVAFATLSPYAHDVLDAIKTWDNPIGQATTWFDEAMAGLQEAIGGKKVPEIDGNELKLWLICLFRGDSPSHPDSIDVACQRRRDAPTEEQKEKKAIDGLNQVSELCETVEVNPPTDKDIKTKVLKSCNKFAETMENLVDANAGLVLMGEVARARTLNDQDVEGSDQVVVEKFIEKGAFGPVANQTETSEIASLYLSHMSAYKIVEVEDDASRVTINHDKPPVWLELLKMEAAFVPEDRADVTQALLLLEGSPHLGQFDTEGRMTLKPVKMCWDQPGLLAFQPPEWDKVAAGIVYLERKFRESGSDLACTPCITDSDSWVLRCGAAEP